MDKESNSKLDTESNTPLASEMYADLKETNLFLRKVLIGCFVIIGLLVAAMTAQHFYHIHKWSEFDTYVVDSGDGGNANLVQGDNTGGIFNGTDSGESPKEGEG